MKTGHKNCNLSPLFFFSFSYPWQVGVVLEECEGIQNNVLIHAQLAFGAVTVFF